MDDGMLQMYIIMFSFDRKGCTRTEVSWSPSHDDTNGHV